MKLIIINQLGYKVLHVSTLLFITIEIILKLGMFSTLYGISLADSHVNTLEKMVGEVKQTLSPWGLLLKIYKKVILLIIQHIKLL